MDDELISRSALKKELEVTPYNDIDDLARTKRLIDNAQTIDAYSFEQVQELVKLNQQFAQEIENLKRPKGKWTNGERECPCCGKDKFKDLDADIWADWRPNFCPNCGADMRDDEE